MAFFIASWRRLGEVKKLRGPKGTKVTITVEREGALEPIDYTITRDIIEINIPDERLTVKITEKELKQRLAAWKPPKPKVKKGYLSIYAQLANTAEKGAALNYRAFK